MNRWLIADTTNTGEKLRRKLIIEDFTLDNSRDWCSNVTNWCRTKTKTTRIRNNDVKATKAKIIIIYLNKNANSRIKEMESVRKLL